MTEELESGIGDREHREKIDARQSSRYSEMMSVLEDVKEMSESRNRLKDLSRKNRKERLQKDIEEFRDEFDEPTYFVELSKRASNRLESLSDAFSPKKSEILERMIRISLTHSDKTRPLLIRNLVLDDLIDKNQAIEEIGEDNYAELRSGMEKDIDVNL